MENQNNKPKKFKSFFDNNSAGVAEAKAATILKRQVDLLERRVKLMEAAIKKIKDDNEQD